MNDEITNYPDHLQRLLDDPLCVARVAAGGGTPVVGYLGNEIPVAVILAAGALPVRLQGKARPTPRADEFLESAFMPELRAVAERWLNGELDFLRSVVFSRADDPAQRLYYYLCELQRRGVCRGPQPLLHEMANIGRASSADYSRESLRRLASALGSAEEKTAAAQRRVAERDALLRELRQRCLASPPLPGSLAWAADRAAGCDWRTDFDHALRQWLNSAPNTTAARRIVLAGDSSPDDSLHRVIEAAGGSVVLELVEAEPGVPVHARQNPVLMMREDEHWVANRARAVAAHAVVFWLIEENEALPWEIARQMRSLAADGMPTLLLSRQRWQLSEPARAQIHDFVAALQVQP